MKRGGRMIYGGKLGEKSQTMINYFQVKTCLLWLLSIPFSDRCWPNFFYRLTYQFSYYSYSFLCCPCALSFVTTSSFYCAGNKWSSSNAWRLQPGNLDAWDKLTCYRREDSSRLCCHLSNITAISVVFFGLYFPERKNNLLLCEIYAFHYLKYLFKLSGSLTKVCLIFNIGTLKLPFRVSVFHLKTQNLWNLIQLIPKMHFLNSKCASRSKTLSTGGVLHIILWEWCLQQQVLLLLALFFGVLARKGEHS